MVSSVPGRDEELQNTVYAVMMPFLSCTGSSPQEKVTCLVSMLVVLKEEGGTEGAGEGGGRGGLMEGDSQPPRSVGHTRRGEGEELVIKL